VTKKINSIKAKALPILKEEGISRSSVFGSYARGEETKNSDLDILVEMPKGKSLLDLVDLEIRLQEALGTKVDLLTYNSVHPLLKKYIQKDEVRIL